MSMNSWDEDALFEEWGWTKNLIQRRYEAPGGEAVTFDNVSDVTQMGPEGEEELRRIVEAFGKK